LAVTIGLQALHDAEINGEVTWWKPSEGFTVLITNDPPHHFANWAAADAWLAPSCSDRRSSPPDDQYLVQVIGADGEAETEREIGAVARG
jgi:hypothetical protein